MIVQYIFVLLLLWCGQACDNNILIGNVAVIGVTGGSDHADSDTGHQACINQQCHALPNLPGDDKLKNKGDWYNMANWNGMSVCAVNDFRFKQNGNDGWQIAKVTVLIRGNNGRVYVPVFRDSFNQWIDGNSVNSQLQTNNLIQSGWRNNFPSTAENVDVQNVYLIAETGHVGDAESDTGHKLRIEFAGVAIEASMPDLPGDDYQKHKTDWWTFNNQFDIINVNDIDHISLKAGGHDGWVAHDVAVLIETNDGWFVPVLMNDIPAKYLQDDGSASDRELDLTMMPNWRGQPLAFTGFEETIGYWEFYRYGNGHESAVTFGDWTGFSENIASEQEQMESYQQEVSVEMGVTVGVGADFGGLGVEQQYSYSVGHSVGTEQAISIRNSIENSIEGGKSVECSQQNPFFGQPYILWVWKTYRKSNIENVAAAQTTCSYHFTTGPNKHIPPNCIPGGCLDNECQSCISPDWVINPLVSQNSCYGSCGGKSNNGNCWCDYICTSWEDCCADYQSQCSRRALGEIEDPERNGKRNLAEKKKNSKRGNVKRLLKML